MSLTKFDVFYVQALNLGRVGVVLKISRGLSEILEKLRLKFAKRLIEVGDIKGLDRMKVN